MLRRFQHRDVPLCYAVFTRHKSYLQIVCLYLLSLHSFYNVLSLTSLLSIFTYSSETILVWNFFHILLLLPDLSVPSSSCSSTTLIIFEFNNSFVFLFCYSILDSSIFCIDIYFVYRYMLEHTTTTNFEILNKIKKLCDDDEGEEKEKIPTNSHLCAHKKIFRERKKLRRERKEILE